MHLETRLDASDSQPQRMSYPPASTSSLEPFTDINHGKLAPAERKQVRRVFGFESSPPSFLGWVGWIYGALYFPIVQILWLISNWPNTPSSGIVKLVRAIGISVTALPLTIDTKARYAVMLEERFGRWANRLFTFVHAISTLTLAVLAMIMLIIAVVQANVPMFFIPAYIIFSIIWMFGSFILFPPFDGGMSPHSIPLFVAGLAMGVFGGFITSTPAFGAMMSAPTTPGTTLGGYLKCESVSVWEKFVAIFP